MKTICPQQIRAAVILLIAWASALGAAPVGTVFTYQGCLTDASSPATGIYDLRFTVYDAVTNGNIVVGPLINPPTPVTNGLFTASLDFGADAFTGAARWLEVAVRAAEAAGDFIVLTPRQALSPVPYAITAAALGSAGSAPVTLMVNGQPALRLEAGSRSPNLVGGYEGNSVAAGVSGAVIAGGGTRRDSPGENGGPEPNTVSANYGFIGAGYGNELTGSASAIVGGRWNSVSAEAYNSFIGGGDGNSIAASFSIIGGGGGNSIGGLSLGGFVGGGLNNSIEGGVDCAAISGGLGNIVGSSPYSVIAGGRYNTLWGGSTDITISGGQSNVVQEHAYGATIAGGQRNTVGGDGASSTIGGGRGNRTTGGAGYATIAGGGNNVADGRASTVAGGENNLSSGYQAFVGGGTGNVAMGDNATVAGGRLNRSGGEGATVGGGANNSSSAQYGTIGGGIFNTNGGTGATVAGGYANTSAGSGAAVGGGERNTCEGWWSTVGGGHANSIQADADYTTISGGATNLIQSDAKHATISGGGGNRIQFDATFASISGGEDNLIETDADHSTISGGKNQRIQVDADFSNISGGEDNSITGGAEHAVIGGGWGNRNRAGGATIGGGGNNTCGGVWATIPGGSRNTAQGQTSFAAGQRAQALHPGTFVWGAATDADVASTNANSWTVRASGGVTFFTAPDLATGAVLPGGSGSWSTLSDRAAKADLAPVDGRAVLEHLARLPLSTWRYKAQAPAVRHVGPMAQDFAAAFGVGEDDRHISSVDADGVALAAIQGLNAVVKEKDAKIADLERRVQILEQFLESQSVRCSGDTR